MSEFRRRLMMTKNGGGGGNDDYKVISPTLIPDTYIAASGAEVSYNGWSSTDFIDLDGYSFVIFVNNGNYWDFYDSSKNPIGRSALTDYKCQIPANAKYLRISDSTTRMNNYNPILSKIDIGTTTLSNIYQSNAYVGTNGVIVQYSGWNVFKVDISQYYGYWENRNSSNAVYKADDTCTAYFKQFFQSQGNSYVLTSISGTSVKCYLLPK